MLGLQDTRPANWDAGVACLYDPRLADAHGLYGISRAQLRPIREANLRHALVRMPDLPGYALALAEDGSLEVEVNKDQNLNDVFAALSAQGIEVVSMRNKANRLEELFMHVVEGRDASAAQPAGAVNS